jgi:hypothetical protein
MSIASYLNYQFLDQNLLHVDSGPNNISLTNNGGSYSLDSNKSSILLKTANNATFPNVDWSTYNDLAISCWIKTTNFTNNDIIMNCGHCNVINTFPSDATNLTAYFTFNSSITTENTLSASNLTYTAGSGNMTIDSANFIRGTGSLVQTTTTANTAKLSSANTGFDVQTSVRKTSFSVSCWVRISNFTVTNQTIFSWGNGTTTSGSQGIIGQFVSNTNFSFTFIGASTSHLSTSGITFATNTWYHIVCTYTHSTTTGTRRIYINGYLAATDVSPVTTPLCNSGVFIIGDPVPASGYNCFVGNLDDFRLYNIVLDANKVISLFNSNFAIIMSNSQLTFLHNNLSLYQTTSYPLTSWTYVLWVIKSSNVSRYPQAVVKLNNATTSAYSFVKITPGSYRNILGDTANSALSSLYISDFRILTIPLTSTIEDTLFNTTCSLYALNSVMPIVNNVYNKLLWSSNLNCISYGNTQVYQNSVKINKGNGISNTLVSQADVDNTMYNLRNLYYNSNLKLNVTTTGVTVNGSVTYTGTSVATSDITLKNVIQSIDNPIERLFEISTFRYIPNDLGLKLGIFYDDHIRLGVSAQDVEKVFPEVVSLSAFDSSNLDSGEIVSKTGSNFLAVSYQELVPVLIECIKELKKEVNAFKKI